MQTIPDNSVQLLLTDIPYARVNKPSHGLRHLDKLDANEITFNIHHFAQEALRITSGSSVIFCGKEQFSPLYEFFVDHSFTTRMVVWEKTNPSPMNGKYVFLSGVECAVHFRKPRATFNASHTNTVFRFPKGSSKRHPTEKPIKLFSRLIEILSNPGDVVCDPCVGSGTTPVAASALKRTYMCCDLNPKYVELTQDRLSENLESIGDPQSR